MVAVVRLARSGDEGSRVLSRKKVEFESERRRLSAWAADGSRLFRQQLERAIGSLADRLVEGAFLPDRPRPDLRNRS